MERTPGVSGEAGTGSGPARAGLVVLMLSVFACVATENSPVGLLPTMAADLQVSEPLMGLVVSLYAALVALFAVPIAAVANVMIAYIASGDWKDERAPSGHQAESPIWRTVPARPRPVRGEDRT